MSETREQRRALWNEDQLKCAVNSVLQHGMSKKRAAKEYGIPRPTLIRHIQKAEAGVKLTKVLPV